jgi:FtsH-binding integral membrane protein
MLKYFAADTRSASLLKYPLAPALLIVSLGILLFSLRILVDFINIIRGERREAQECEVPQQTSHVGN